MLYLANTVLPGGDPSPQLGRVAWNPTNVTPLIAVKPAAVLAGLLLLKLLALSAAAALLASIGARHSRFTRQTSRALL